MNKESREIILIFFFSLLDVLKLLKNNLLDNCHFYLVTLEYSIPRKG